MADPDDLLPTSEEIRRRLDQNSQERKMLHSLLRLIRQAEEDGLGDLIAPTSSDWEPRYRQTPTPKGQS